MTSLLDARLAAPLDSRTANPRSTITPAGTTISVRELEVADIQLRSHNLSFRGRQVPDPHEVEEQQYLDDERTGLLAQAQALTERAPNSAVAWARFAQAHLSFGEIDQAVNAAAEALRHAPQGPPDEPNDLPAKTARFMAARVLAAAGDDTAAEEALRGLSGEGPWTVLYAAMAERLGEHRQALARLGRAQSIEALAFRGYLLLQMKEPQQALRQFRAARRAGGNEPALLLNLAYAYAMLGSSHKAVRAARQAVVLAPNSRHASFNLASYLRASGSPSEALAELRRLRAARGDGDPQVASAIADALVECGDVRQALRELRRAQHHSMFSEQSPKYAQLAANVALLEWMLGELSRADVLKVVREQLALAGPQLSLALMLADTASHTDVLPEVEALHHRLRGSLPEAELVPLTIRLLLLKGDVKDAARAAIAHAESNPLDVDAVRGGIILWGQVFGDYDLAGDMGRSALRRIPADPGLINNVAFCLALAGRGGEARMVLAGRALDSPYLVATSGLVDLSLGKIADGLARYDEAALLIRSTMHQADERADFEQLLRTHEALALHELGLANHPDVPTELTMVVVPEHWQHDPGYLILRQIAERLDAPWIDSGGSR